MNSNSRDWLAYHEAGHAAMTCFFGNYSHLSFIDMQGDSYSSAFVRHERLSGPGFIAIMASRADPLAQSIARYESAKSIMLYLAGPCAENKFGPREPDWFDQYMDLACYLIEGSDFSHALAAAAALYGNTHKADQWVRRISTWTDEAMDDERLWLVVETLAQRLLQTDRLEGQEAIEIMAKTWGVNRQPLCFESRWRRRFKIKTGS